MFESRTTITERHAGAGARILDERCPGWHARIDPAKINFKCLRVNWLSDFLNPGRVIPNTDILGLLFGDLRAGCKELGLQYANRRDLLAKGFWLWSPTWFPKYRHCLREAWRREIQARQRSTA